MKATTEYLAREAGWQLASQPKPDPNAPTTTPADGNKTGPDGGTGPTEPVGPKDKSVQPGKPPVNQPA